MNFLFLDSFIISLSQKHRNKNRSEMYEIVYHLTLLYKISNIFNANNNRPIYSEGFGFSFCNVNEIRCLSQ